jgi:3-phosphoshikimate 1-carboxyvinyltransferase
MTEAFKLQQAPTAKYARIAPEADQRSTPPADAIEHQHLNNIRVPGSKSLTNRALLLAAVADGQSVIDSLLLADDTIVMIDALGQLGVHQRGTVFDDGYASARLTGLGGAPAGPREVYCGMAGTVGRFLVPMLAAGTGEFKVDAHEQLRRRPLGPVLQALRAQGATVDGESFPLTLTADGLAGGQIDVDASVSSQFLSGLLMAAPLAKGPTVLRFGQAVSAPYIQLTLDVMRAFGVEPEIGAGEIVVTPAAYRAVRYQVEPDASTASYFLASAALTGKTVTLPGLSREVTHQGDIEIVDFLHQMGCQVDADPEADGAVRLTGPAQLHGVDVNMQNSSDVFMTLACVAPFADTPTTIEGIGNTRVKESDRIAACAENLLRLGIRVEEGPDWIRIHPGTPTTAVLKTYEDHRIAMAFSLIGTHTPVILEDPGCVAKTAPMFFEIWPQTGASVEFADEADAW